MMAASSGSRVRRRRFYYGSDASVKLSQQHASAVSAMPTDSSRLVRYRTSCCINYQRPK